MKIEKVSLWLHWALKKVSDRFEMNPVTPSEWLTFLVVKIGVGRYTNICNYMKSIHKFDKTITTTKTLQSLIERGMLARTESGYVVTPKGREFYSGVRRFLLNKRV